MDGLIEIYDRWRRDNFCQVELSARSCTHSQVAIIYLIERNTADGIHPVFHWVQKANSPVVRDMFYFQTCNCGREELFFLSEEYAPSIECLRSCMRVGFPFKNSRVGLLALKFGDGPGFPSLASVTDVDGESIWFRASDAMREGCGIAACTHILEFKRLRLGTIIGIKRDW